MRKTEPENQRHGNVEQTDSCQQREVGRWKEREGISQRTCMNDPWTWTTVWSLTRDMGLGWAVGSKRGKLGQL